MKGERRFDRHTHRGRYMRWDRACSDSTTRQGIFPQPPKLRARTISELQVELTLLTLGLQGEIMILLLRTTSAVVTC